MKLLLLVLGALSLVSNAAMAETASTLPVVSYITAAEKPVYNETSYVGRIQSPQLVALEARVTGYLEQQAFTDGDQVQKGQLLYVIEQPPYQAAVAQARAAVEAAQAQSHNADLTLARARALLRTPAGQQSTVDAAAASAQSDTAQIDSSSANLLTAQINLGYTEIRSPIDGQISATTVNTGNVVGPNSGTLATIVAEDPMYVTFALPMVDALKFRNTPAAGGLAGLDLLVQLPDGSMYRQTGVINFVNNQVSTNTDTLNWRGTIANPLLPNRGRELTAGEFVTVILRDRTPQQKITIPQDAVITDQLGDYVLEVDASNTAIRRPVVQGAATNDSVQIDSGIKAGDRVIIDGIERIHAGIKVTPKPAASPQ